MDDTRHGGVPPLARGQTTIASVHSLDLILTISGGLTAALVLGYITQRLGLSPIVGYLIAGTLVGPYTPGFVANGGIAEQLAEVGVILLMFGVGLQFHIEELLAVRRVAIPGAIAQSLAATALGAVIAKAFGWAWSSGIVFGMALSVASTVVLIRILSDNRDLHTPTGHIAVGWLVVEDLFTVLALVLLPALFGGERSSPAIAVVITVIKVGALIVLTMVIGTRAIPRILDYANATGSRELFTLTVLVLALGIAVGSSLVFGVSMALGAFLAGLVVGRSEYSLRAASEALPMRDAFAVLFFVSVGMLLDPRALLDAPGLFAATLAVVVVGKPVIAFALVRLLKYPFRVSLAVAIALAQIGEFSFILSSMGRELGLLTSAASNTIVAASILSIVLNPLLYRLIIPVERWAAARPRLWHLLNPPPPIGGSDFQSTRPPDPRGRAIVVGYGPTGRTVTRLLRDNGIAPTIVELNVDTVRRLRHDGIDALYGDATQLETLEGAGAAGAGSLILTSAGMNSSSEVIRIARGLNPRIRVLARAAYLRDLPELRTAGADVVFSGEGEVALALTEAILQRLGATPDQIDRERDRAHRELSDESPSGSAIA
jgi:CPA2 family monovalent cation:H+ antiporter-2